MKSVVAKSRRMKITIAREFRAFILRHYERLDMTCTDCSPGYVIVNGSRKVIELAHAFEHGWVSARGK